MREWGGGVNPVPKYSSPNITIPINKTIFYQSKPDFYQ